ncbi:MAG: hypothetical protein N3A00_01280 [Thermodesulfovibrio sp.]|nr:hypothetical protein [Thermodesulfovibrio sp.]
MKLNVNENIWAESLSLSSRQGIFTKELIVIILIFVLILIETPAILLLIKKFSEKSTEFFMFTIIMIGLILGIFLMVFLSAPPKLFEISIKRMDNILSLGWIKNLIFRSRENLSFEFIKKMNISLHKIKNENRIRMEIDKIDGRKINTVFTLDTQEPLENTLKIFLNMANIIGFQSYTAYSTGTGYIITFSKGLEEKRRIDENKKDVIFESDKTQVDKEAIKIPNLIIKELNSAKAMIYKKPNFYDILRLLFVFIFYPLLLIFLVSLPKDNEKYMVFSFALFMYIFIFYLIRRYLSPMETVMDKLRGTVKVKKIIFSLNFPLSQIKQIEISDQISGRTNTFFFHVDARLHNGRRHQLFYTEFTKNKEKIYEVYENMNLLLSNISKEMNIPIVDKTKNI